MIRSLSTGVTHAHSANSSLNICLPFEIYIYIYIFTFCLINCIYTFIDIKYCIDDSSFIHFLQYYFFMCNSFTIFLIICKCLVKFLQTLLFHLFLYLMLDEAYALTVLDKIIETV